MSDDKYFSMFDVMDRNAQEMGTLPPKRKRRKPRRRINKPANPKNPSEVRHER